MIGYVGIGANVGSLAQRISRFQRAIQEIGAFSYVSKVIASSVYTSAPVGPVGNQPAFLNAVFAVEICQTIGPTAFLRDLLELERQLGRIRTGQIAQGPRVIDVDLLLMGSLVVAAPGPPRTHVPHPRLCERAFVLRPLAELVESTFLIPGSFRTVGECLQTSAVQSQRIERLDGDLLSAL